MTTRLTIELFLDHFDDVATYNGWNSDLARVLWLQDSLRGSAAGALALLSGPPRTWDEACKLLRARYPTKETRKYHSRSLRDLTQGQKDTLLLTLTKKPYIDRRNDTVQV